MANLEEIQGIVLYNRKHRERDFLVKIYTREYGKLMFFVRGSKRQNNELIQAIQPFTQGTFIADIRDQGLSFLRGPKDIRVYRNIQSDIFKNAYATYICSLADAALEDRNVNLSLFRQLEQSLSLIEEGYEPEVVANIIEVKFLTYFGVAPNFTYCAICQKTEGAFDYSDKFHGILCVNHYYEDARRLRIDSKAMHIIRLYSVINLDRIGEISIKSDTQVDIRRLIDHIYDESIGLHLKSKKFINSLNKYENFFKNDN